MSCTMDRGKMLLDRVCLWSRRGVDQEALTVPDDTQYVADDAPACSGRPSTETPHAVGAGRLPLSCFCQHVSPCPVTLTPAVISHPRRKAWLNVPSLGGLSGGFSFP